jgi:hypothetical protein
MMEVHALLGGILKAATFTRGQPERSVEGPDSAQT